MLVKLNEKEIEIKALSINDWIKMEDNHGSLADIKKKNDGSIPFKILRYVFWLSIVKTIPAITEDEAGNMIVPNEKSFMDIMGYLLGGKEPSPL